MTKKIRYYLLYILILILTLTFYGCSIKVKKDFIVYNTDESELYFDATYGLKEGVPNVLIKFPVVTNDNINSIKNVVFYNGNNICCDKISISSVKFYKEINNDFILSMAEFSFANSFEDDINITAIAMKINGIDIIYSVNINFVRISDGNYGIYTQGDMLLEYNDSTFTVIYGFETLPYASKVIDVKCVTEGIDIEKIYIADGTCHMQIDGELPWIFVEFNSTNQAMYKNTVMKFVCNYSKLRSNTLFFRFEVAIIVNINGEVGTLVLPAYSSNSLVSMYPYLVNTF